MITSFLEAGNVNGKEEMDVGDGTSYFSDFFEDNVVALQCPEYKGVEDQGNDHDAKFVRGDSLEIF